MKYTITINQSAVFSNGMVNKTDLVDWAIIDYLKDFAIYRNARKIVCQGEEYIWLNYNHLINSLPLANLKYKAKLAHRINKLRDLGLIKTVKNVDNTLYYTFTDKLIDICFAKQSDINRLRKVYDNPIAKNATPPVIKSITAPVIKTITAQYKTKISIINKDTNKKDFSFSSSFKNHKTNTKPHGFTTMSGSVWKILADIKERQKISSMKNKQITRSNL